MDYVWSRCTCFNLAKLFQRWRYGNESYDHCDDVLDYFRNISHLSTVLGCYARSSIHICVFLWNYFRIYPIIRFNKKVLHSFTFFCVICKLYFYFNNRSNSTKCCSNIGISLRKFNSYGVDWCSCRKFPCNTAEKRSKAWESRSLSILLDKSRFWWSTTKPSCNNFWTWCNNTVLLLYSDIFCSLYFCFDNFY
jgi:hypothetical protein